MDKFIPLSVPNLCGNEKKYVNEALVSQWVSTAGPFVKRFEKEFAQYLGVDDAVACQSGTAGIHLALRALDIGRDDEVIVPTLTFIAAINPVKYVGAEPIFMDCDDSLCIDPQKVLDFINLETKVDGEFLVNKKTGKRIKAIIAVHVFGNMCDMVALKELCEKYHLYLIEDSTEALGTKYTEGIYAGCFAGTMGDVGVYSFNGNKIITTGGGGMVVSHDQKALNHIRYLSTQAKDDDIHFIHNEIGYNYRMTNVQAAIGVGQLERLEEFIQIKKNNYELYKLLLNQIDSFNLWTFREGTRPNYWFYSLYLNERCTHSVRDYIEKLSYSEIQTRPVWGLIHEQQPYLGCRSYRVEKAKAIGARILNVPCSSNLSRDDIVYVTRKIMEI